MLGKHMYLLVVEHPRNGEGCVASSDLHTASVHWALAIGNLRSMDTS